MENLSLKNLSKQFNIPLVGVIDPISDIREFASDVKDMSGIEGFVIKFDSDGYMLKIKCAEYINLHRTRDVLSIEKKCMGHRTE